MACRLFGAKPLSKPVTNNIQRNRKYRVIILGNGPLTSYVKLRVAHASGMTETFSPPPRASDPDMHHGTCVTYVPWCMPGLLTSGFLWNQWRGKRSRHSLLMRNQEFYVSGKRPMMIQFIHPHMRSRMLDKLILVPYIFTKTHVSGNCLVPSSNKPLPGPALAKLYDVIWHH